MHDFRAGCGRARGCHESLPAGYRFGVRGFGFSPARFSPLRSRSLGKLFYFGLRESWLAWLSAIVEAGPRRAIIPVTSSSEQSVQGSRQRKIFSACYRLAKPWPSSENFQNCWRELTWEDTAPTGKCKRSGSHGIRRSQHAPGQCCRLRPDGDLCHGRLALKRTKLSCAT